MSEKETHDDPFMEEDTIEEVYDADENIDDKPSRHNDYDYEPAPRANSSKVIIVVLVVVLIVLVGTVVYMYTKRSDANQTASTTTNNTPANTNANASANASGTAGSAVEEDNTPFDPATATKVPAGETPEQYLEKYLQACVDKDWNTAYNMLPLGKKTSYGNATEFGNQLAGYNITGGKTSVVSKTDDQQVLNGTMETSYGDFTYPWTFVKDNGTWYAKTRGAIQMSSGQ